MTVPYRQFLAFEDKAAMDGCSQHAIHLSRQTGMAPADIEGLCDFTREEVLLVVVRCPKPGSRYYQGKFQPKTLATSMKGIKSDARTGLIQLPDGRTEVSDYDLMCVYRYGGACGYSKVFFSGVDVSKKRSPFTPEARDLMLRAQRHVQSKFQHGAQDDFNNPDNPNVNPGAAQGGRGMPDRFAVFNCGKAEFCPTPAEVKRRVYDRFKLDWPYDEGGKFLITAKPGGVLK
jgi:hypothetical protein